MCEGGGVASTSVCGSSVTTAPGDSTQLSFLAGLPLRAGRHRRGDLDYGRAPDPPEERGMGARLLLGGGPHALLSDQCSLSPILPVKGEGDRILGC